MSFVTTRCSMCWPASSRPSVRTVRRWPAKSTLNRLEHRPRREAGKYHKIDYDAPSLEALFVDIFLDGHKRAPKEIVLDLDATDDTIHGEQEGRFFHGYYDSYCYLPLYIFCGRFLLGAQAAPRQHRRGRRPRSTRSPGSSPASGPAGRRCGSCCAAIRASAARS